MFLPQNRRPHEDWGKWFQAKANAVELARKQAPKVAGQAVYMSSVTDPYLPAERSLELTRGILEALLPHQPRLLIQTRGPLVVRDLDLLRQFRAVRVNMSIPTDSEEVRRVFEPKAPPLERRWEAVGGGAGGGRAGRHLRDADAAAGESGGVRGAAGGVAAGRAGDAGIPRQRRAASASAERRGSCWERGWTEGDYRRCVEELRRHLPVYEGKGVLPAAGSGGRELGGGSGKRRSSSASTRLKIPSMSRLASACTA